MVKFENKKTELGKIILDSHEGAIDVDYAAIIKLCIIAKGNSQNGFNLDDIEKNLRIKNVLRNVVTSETKTTEDYFLFEDADFKNLISIVNDKSVQFPVHWDEQQVIDFITYLNDLKKQTT